MGAGLLEACLTVLDCMSIVRWALLAFRRRGLGRTALLLSSHARQLNNFFLFSPLKIARSHSHWSGHVVFVVVVAAFITHGWEKHDILIL